jgi:hypothetical protein
MAIANQGPNGPNHKRQECKKQDNKSYKKKNGGAEQLRERSCFKYMCMTSFYCVQALGLFYSQKNITCLSFYTQIGMYVRRPLTNAAGNGSSTTLVCPYFLNK